MDGLAVLAKVEETSTSRDGRKWRQQAAVVCSGTLLVAGTLLLVAAGDRSREARRPAVVLSEAGARQQSLMMKAAARVKSMLAGESPSMALQAASPALLAAPAAELGAPASPWGAAPSSAGLAMPPSPGGESAATMAASLKGERARMRSQMLAKFNAASEGTLPVEQARPATAPATAPAGQQVHQLATAQRMAKPAQLQQMLPALPELPPAPQQVTPPAAAEATIAVPQSVVQAMEAQIAQLSAKVQTLEQHPQPALRTALRGRLGC